MPKKDLAVVQTAIDTSAEEVETVDATLDDDWFAPIEETLDYVNALYWGKEGSGKTTAAARMANMDQPGKVLFINAEGGLKKVPLRKRGVDLSRIVVWPKPGNRVTRQGLDDLHRRIKNDLMKYPDSWLGVVMDSGTEVMTATLDGVQRKRVRKLMEQGKEPDPDHVDIADYGTMTKMMRDYLRKFRDLPCHFIVTALERRDIDKDTGKPMYGPAVTPGLATDLLGYVDFVLFFKAADEEGPFRALTKGSARYRVKDRFDVLPRVLAEPMFDRLTGYVTGDLTEDTDPFQDDLPVKGGIPAPDPNEEDDDDEDDESESA